MQQDLLNQTPLCDNQQLIQQTIKMCYIHHSNVQCLLSNSLL